MVLEGSNLETLTASLGACRQAEQRLEALLDQLDPLTRPRRGRRPKIVVEDVLRKVEGILSVDLRKARVTMQIPKTRHAVLAWEADLFHAFFNLFHNSLHWVQKRSGDRVIKTRIREPRPGRVEVMVADTGPGISESSAGLVFDLGYTEKPDGLGLGLFIAKEGIERSRGTIELVNPGEAGAAFRVVLESR